jgi:hypothetical protein
MKCKDFMRLIFKIAKEIIARRRRKSFGNDWFMWLCLDVNLCHGLGVYTRCVCTTSESIKKRTRLLVRSCCE